ncbi:hypothetical protein CFHF_13090 [Caulobacter flavus]|uniref:Phasin domain-containing protein n=1 Tax=Caulobacter flavus TaxID=1679497 RepID=A0A2N5CTC3_9CAUL|nr:hypothetical protein [Caulobacter flavus]AYV49248.1 hypothetical protein C1707_25035 [Caulobacter flavus]PLR14894.1 hypothetical protein CFHF_13090 [Caulobacter flavus]
MSSTVTSSTRRFSDHFEPQDIDPQEQRRLRGHLEQIDYTAFLSNREIMAQTLGRLDAGHFQKLAVTTAQARAKWAAVALAIGQSGRAPDAAEVEKLAALRLAYDELSAAYEALRRMVERGYVAYGPAASS